ncbi:MAG: glycine-rich domain-containing protein [Blastocatellia bacterium]
MDQFTQQPFQPLPLNSQLWQALKEFSVGEPGAQLSFVRRLARENRWSVAYAQRVFDEYKRFVFLAISAGHKVTPSDEVDQAWHLHLAYTESYWTEMCGKLLGQPLHHGPTKGGQQEDDKYLDWYSRTLESYERIFGHKPPADIWPSPGERFDRKLRFARLNTAGYWLLKKPEWNFKRLAAGSALTLLSALTLSACASRSSGRAMMAILIGLAVAFVLFVIVRLISNQNSGDSSGGSGCSSFMSSGCSSSDSGSDSGGDSGGDGGSSGCGGGGCGGGGCGS